MKNWREFFEEPFEKSQELDNTFAKICDEEGLKKGIDYLISQGATKLDMDSYEILYYINEFTKNKYSEEEKENIILNLKKKDKFIKNATIGFNDHFKLQEALIETTEETIKIMQFSSLESNIKELLPEIDTDNRIKKCYNYAYEISRHIGIKNEIVTGYIYGYTDISKFLHSWVEINYKGQDYVIDGTLNAIVNKEGYYALRHVEPLAKISNETLEKDITNYLSKIGIFGLPTYLVFRDEIINDLEKNTELFKK